MSTLPSALRAFLKGQQAGRANPRAPLPEWPWPASGPEQPTEAVAPIVRPLSRVRDLLGAIASVEGDRGPEVAALFDVIEALGADDMVMPDVRRALERNRKPTRKVWAQLNASGWTARHPRLAHALCSMVYRSGLPTVGLAAALVEAGHTPEEALMRLRAHLWRAPNAVERIAMCMRMASDAFTLVRNERRAARGQRPEVPSAQRVPADAHAWAVRFTDALEVRAGRSVETLWLEALTDPRQPAFWTRGWYAVTELLVRRAHGELAGNDTDAYDFGFEVPLDPYTPQESP